MQDPKHIFTQGRHSNLLPPDTMPHHETLDLREFGRTLSRYQRMIGFITAAITLLMLLYALFSAAVYKATATLQIDREPTKIGTLELPNAGDIRDTRDFYQTQFELIQSHKVASQVIDDLRLLETLPAASFSERLKLWLGFMQPEERRANIEDALLENLTVEPVKNSRLVAISYTAKDAKTAAEYANAFVDAFVSMNGIKLHSTLNNALTALQQSISENEYQQLKLAADTLPNNISVIDSASAPHRQQKPKLLVLLLLGTLLGLLVGMATAFLRDFLDHTVRNVDNLERETQLPVLAVIPETAAPSPSVLANMVLRKTRSAIAEAFRTLRTALHFQLPTQKDGYVLLITSSCANEGKTTVTCNLACTYAQAGHRVLIIDTDLRNPTAHKLLNVHSKIGLSDYLADKVDAFDIIEKTSINNLFLIPAGWQPQDPADMLASPLMKNLLSEMRREFDYILLDTPPVLGLADTLVLTPLAATTLLTVRAESTQMDMVRQVLKRLRQARAPLGGIILNSADFSNSRSYGYAYAAYPYAEAQNESLTSYPQLNTIITHVQHWVKRLTRT